MIPHRNVSNRWIPLQTQEQFETLYNSELKDQALIYFTADWCGACKRIDWDFILEEFPDLDIYRCDIDENKYTPGFCGIRSIPNFVMVSGSKKIVGPFQSSDTAKVATWIHTTLGNAKSK